MSRPSLGTKRLLLSPAGPSDAQRLQALWNEPEVRRYLWDDEPVSAERTVQAIDAGNAAFRERGFGLWCVNLTHSGSLAGFVGMREFGEARDVEVLFGVSPARARLGYGVEAVHAALVHGFEKCSLPTIWSRCDEPNARGIALVEKLGMTLRRTQPGRRFPIRDYAVSKEQLRPPPPPPPKPEE